MGSRTWPCLFKRTTTGAIQCWTIRVVGNVIHTVYGQQDGKMQETQDVISVGKNVGRANETTPGEQAMKEAEAKFQGKFKRGYVQELDRAEQAESNHEGGVAPMLAQAFAKHAHKIVYPAFCQPKLDGIRCIAVYDASTPAVTLWTRTRKPIDTVPHINEALEVLFVGAGIDRDLVVDGELYNHEMRDQFEQIVSRVRKQRGHEDAAKIQYHIYDCVQTDVQFSERWATIQAWLLESDREVAVGKKRSREEPASPLRLVSTRQVADEGELMEAYEEYVHQQGYEGAIVRNAAGLYREGARSYDLQKIKEFEDAEFDVVDVSEGRGKLAGHAATFVCRTDAGHPFEAKMRGDTERLREYWENHDLWKGKRLTVQYQGLTNKNQVPRFPVGVALRDYE